MKVITGPMPTWLKRTLAIAGLLLALPGPVIVLAFVCLTLLLVVEGDESALEAGLITFTLTALTLGAGGVVFWHGLRSLRGKPSKPLHLYPIWTLAGLFGLLVAMGLFISENEFGTGLFFPPILLAAAALPPLMAVSWFRQQHSGGLTWRRGLVALAGGATVSVFVALALEILFPTVILALVFNLAKPVMNAVEALFEALAGEKIAAAITGRGFLYAFIQIALIAPLAEELAKPLVTLPLIGRLTQRDAFLVGAMAGVGFATLENVLYAGFGFHFWAGILIVRALGGAIHPLGAGLVTLGWRQILRGEPGAWSAWLVRFGLAAGIHALWNGGSLIVITLAGAQFFGELPPEINVIGLSAGGTTLALLTVLGLAALWLGRATAADTQQVPPLGTKEVEATFVLSNRAMAIWGLACLAAIVPAGIAGLQLLVR